MKNIAIYILLICGVFVSCQKGNDRIFDESPNIRVKEKLDAYQKQLIEAANGWKVTVEPRAGGRYTFYFKFNNENRVAMFADFTQTAASVIDTSSYRLKALQEPSILFDTYSYLHLLADPDPTVNGGTRGAGLQSDFEFYFDEASTADTIKLIGRFNGSNATLVKATAQEATAFTSGQFSNIVAFSNVSRMHNYFKRVTINGILYDFNITPTTRTIVFSWIDVSGNVRSFTTQYYYTIDGVILENPLQAGNQIVSVLRDPSWNAVNNSLSFSVNGTNVTVLGTGTPLKVDLGAAQRWYEAAVREGTYYFSWDGFHVNGVDDAFNVNSVPSFYYLIFFPEFYSDPYDLLAPGLLSGNSVGLSSYRPVFDSPPVFNDNGTIKFTYFGYAGTGTPPTPINNTIAMMNSAGGFYIVQTGTTTYDMVSAADGKSWITWELN